MTDFFCFGCNKHKKADQKAVNRLRPICVVCLENIKTNMSAAAEKRRLAQGENKRRGYAAERFKAPE